jgi:cytochrome c556
MRRFVVGITLLFAPVALSAPPSPANVVKYRYTVMKAAGSHMAALSMIAKGESDRTQDMVLHAESLLAVSRTLSTLFPEGTGPTVAGLETEAKAEIWTQKEKFAAAVKKFEDESVKLVEIAKKGDVALVKVQLGAVGGSCGDCHDAYRVEDEH